jgi:uncharacterized protein
VRGLAALSFGNLFASYVLFTAPESFSHYLIGSPSLYWDKRMMFEREQAYSDRSDALPARVFLSAGTEEGGMILPDLLRLAEIVAGRNYAGLELHYHVFQGETHMSGLPATMSRGLRYVFGNR